MKTFVRHSQTISFYLFLLMLLLLTPQLAHSSALPILVKPGQITMPMQSGSIAGGLGGRELSLISIKENPLRGGGMQIVVSYGDRGGSPVKGEPGYFHIAIDRGSKRISMDLAQVTRTAVDQKDLSKTLNGLPMVAGSDMTMDPQDSSTNITLNLKQAVSMKVKSENGSQARVVLELRPLAMASR